MANADPKPTAPAAAVARHLEWLEFALNAARDEETRRKGRLERATDKNRDKRSVRLAEVRAEVRELDALVKGIKELNARPAASTRKAAPRVAKAKTSPAAKSSPTAKPATTTRRRAKSAPASASAAPSTSSTRSTRSNGAKGPATPAPATPRRPRGRPRTVKPTPPSA
jgi:hypothetical protein